MAGIHSELQIPESPARAQNTGWSSIRPDVRAALLVSPVIILCELVTSLVPVLGYALTLPLALATYLVQGFLAGRFTREDPAFAPARAGECARRGALSGLWTSLLVSNLITLIVLLAAAPLTLGTFLLGLPALIAGSLLDVGLNACLSALGAWLYAVLGGKWAAGLSCLLGLIGLGLTCSLVTAAGLLAASILSGRIHLP